MLFREMVTVNEKAEDGLGSEREEPHLPATARCQTILK
jgi:hypothetical protein